MRSKIDLNGFFLRFTFLPITTYTWLNKTWLENSRRYYLRPHCDSAHQVKPSGGSPITPDRCQAKKSDGFMASTTPSIVLATSWFMTGELTFFWILLRVSCLMCFAPKLIELNLHADRFITTTWGSVGKLTEKYNLFKDFK